METFDVDVRRDGEWWSFDIPALSAPSPRGEGHRILARDQARRAADVAPEAKAIIAMWLDSDDDVALEIHYPLSVEVEVAMRTAREKEAVARSAEKEAAVARRLAARTLVENERCSQADAAVLLGVSRQRVQQLIAD